MSDIEFCERNSYQVPPPPPNRIMSSGWFCGGIETDESKQLAEHYHQLRAGWNDWTVERRKIELARYLAHHDRVHGVVV